MTAEMRSVMVIGVLIALAGAAAIASAGSAAAWGLILEAGGMLLACVGAFPRSDAPPAESAARRSSLPWGAALIGLSLAAHWNTLDAGFSDADDWAALYLGRILGDPGSQLPLFIEWSVDRAIHLSHSGLFLLFAAERAIFGLWAPGYHAVNLVLLGTAGWCVFGVARLLLKDDAAAFFGAALFVLHPRLWEVATVTSRAEWTMLTICCLGGTVAYLRYLECGRRRFLLLSFAAVLAGAFMRETAMLAPLLIAGAARFAGNAAGPGRRAGAASMVPHLLTAAILAIHLFGPHLAGRPDGGYEADAGGPVPAAGGWTGAVVGTLFKTLSMSLAFPIPGFASPAPGWLNTSIAAVQLAGFVVLVSEAARGKRTFAFGLLLLVLGALPVIAHRPDGGFEDRHLVWMVAGWAMLASAAFAAVPGRRLIRTGIAAALAVAFFAGTSAASRESMAREKDNAKALERVALLAKTAAPASPVVIALDAGARPVDESALALAAFSGRPAGEVILARDAVISPVAGTSDGSPREAGVALLIHDAVCLCWIVRDGRVNMHVEAVSAPGQAAPPGRMEIAFDRAGGHGRVTSANVRTFRSAFDVLRRM